MATYDARHNARHSRRFRVTLGQGSSFTVDVCAGGFCIESMRVLPLRSTVEGSIRVNGKELAFGGQVVWVKRADSGSNVGGTMGVRFTRVPWDLQRLLDSPGRGEECSGSRRV